MDEAANVLRHHPEIAIFLAVALGYYVGRLRFGSFTLGTVAATLLIGVVLGQLRIVINPLVKTIFFDMFIFVVTYPLGPHVVRGSRREAFPQAVRPFVLYGTTRVMACLAAASLGHNA